MAKLFKRFAEQGADSTLQKSRQNYKTVASVATCMKRYGRWTTSRELYAISSVDLLDIRDGSDDHPVRYNLDSDLVRKMGNVSSLARASSALDSYVAELGNDISYEKSLSSSRFLKTILVRHAYGLLVVKLFIKPDPMMSLRLIQRRLKNQRDALSSISHTLSYSTFVETEKAGYLIRQWAGASLYDRISTRPYLNELEKRWIAFQVLTAMRDARAREVSHGDIKSENILIDPSLNVHITDFASAFKPTYLPLNDPSDFSYFYDSSGRRTCYIAPERFYTDDSKIAAEKRSIHAQASTHQELGGISGSASWIGNGIGKRDGKVTEEMDMFSIGCSLLEMWTDGASVFTLSELYNYREGQTAAVDNLLNSLEDETVKEMLATMLALNPEDRPTCEKVLVDYRNTIFPDYFYTFLQDYVNDMHADAGGAAGAQDPTVKFASKADEIVEAIADDWSGIIRAVIEEHQLSVGNSDAEAYAEPKVVDHTGPAILLLNILTSNMRNCLRASSRIKALEPVLPIADLIPDEEVIDRIIPYVVALLKDEIPQVRAVALETLVQLLSKVEVITPGNAGLVSEYILPNLRHLAEDEDLHVRSTFAQQLPALSEIGMHVMEMAQSMNWSENIIPSHFDLDQNLEPDYDASLEELLETLADQASTIFVDPKSDVRRSALANIIQLCLVFGRTKTNDVLLIRMITYLNDQDWRLRCTFLESIVSVAAFVGATSLEEFVLPLMEQALADPEDYVVSRVLISLSSLIELGLFEKARILELFSRTYGFLCHPNAWVRQAAASFIAIAAHHLEDCDTWCILYPYIRPLLKADVPEITACALLDVVSEPLSVTLLEAARQWYMANPKSTFWSAVLLPGKAGNRSKAFRMGPQAETSLPVATNDVDRRYLQLLRQRGLEAKSDVKLSSLKVYLAVQAAVTRDRKGVIQSPEQSTMLGGRSLSLQEMHVTPLTIFVNEKQNPNRQDTQDSRKHLHRKPSTNSSRRPSFANRPVRQRVMSQDSSASDAEQVTELRRRLVALDSLRMSQHDVTSVFTPVDSEGPATPRPGDLRRSDSVTSVPSTNIQDKSVSARTARSKGSLGSETKAAPAVGASPAIATGQLEIAAHMRLVGLNPRTSEPGSPRLEAKEPPAINITGKPYNTTYEGRDPGILSLLETAWQETGAAIDEAFHFIPSPGPAKRRTPRSKSSRLMRDSNREVTLIAHLPEHDDEIAGLVVSPELSYFAIVDILGNITIWETNRLERSVTTKPRLCLALNSIGRVTSVCAIDSTHCFAVAGTDGCVDIVRIQVATTGTSVRPVKLVLHRRFDLKPDEGHVVSLAYMKSGDRPCVLLATSKARLRVIDLTTLETKLDMQQPSECGRITSLYVDPKHNWAVTGTSAGVLALWDMRYGINVRKWSCPGRVLLIQGHPGNSGKWILVSCASRKAEGRAAEALLYVYDIATTNITQILAVTSGDDGISSLHDLAVPAEDEQTPATQILAVARRKEAENMEDLDPFTERAEGDDEFYQDILAVHSIHGPRSGSSLADAGLGTVPESTSGSRAGDERPIFRQTALIVTSGEDRIVRLWNMTDVPASMVISGSGRDAEKVYRSVPADSPSGARLIVEQPAHQTAVPSHSLGSKLARALAQERQEGQAATQHARQLLRPHLTAVTAIASFETPFSSALVVVTGDRSGVVKAWRVGWEG